MEKYIVKLEEGIPFLFVEEVFTPPTIFQEEKPVPVINYIRKGRVSSDSEYVLGEYYTHRDICAVETIETFDVYKKSRKDTVYRIKKFDTR